MSRTKIKTIIETHLRTLVGILIPVLLLLSSCGSPTVTVTQTYTPDIQSSQTAVPISSSTTTSPKTYTLVITMDGEGSTSPGAGSHTFSAGQPVTIFAIGDQGWKFDGWSGDTSSNLSSITVNMDSDKKIAAKFSQKQTYNLTVEVNGTGDVNPSAGVHSYAPGVTVSLTATPGNQQEFYGWSGAVVQNSPSLSITMDKDITLTANFSSRSYSLSLDVNGSGSTNPTSGRYTYDPGTIVPISALPDTGWEFTGWNGNVADPNSASTTVTMDQFQSATANFSRASVERIVYGPETRKIGKGDTIWSINISPGENAEFSFTTTGDKVNYSVTAPNGTLLLASGVSTSTGQGSFTAAISGYYWLRVESAGESLETTVTMSYKVYSTR